MPTRQQFFLAFTLLAAAFAAEPCFAQNEEGPREGDRPGFGRDREDGDRPRFGRERDGDRGPRGVA